MIDAGRALAVQISGLIPAGSCKESLLNRMTDAARDAFANLSRAGQQWLFFGAALAVEVAIFIVDVLAGSGVRLHTLYSLPVSVIALKCERRWMRRTAFVMSMAFQMFTYWRDQIPWFEYILDASVAAVSLLLAMALAGMARVDHQRAVELATSDELTGIANRRAFFAAADAEIIRQKRRGGVLLLAVLDLDGFKLLNDTRGHRAGDDALRLLSSILVRSVRISDTPARVGGDEFAMLMPGMPEEECGAFCKEITDEIARSMAAAGFPITASVGFASFDAPPASSTAAVAQADAAMYCVKLAARCARTR